MLKITKNVLIVLTLVMLLVITGCSNAGLEAPTVADESQGPSIGSIISKEVIVVYRTEDKIQNTYDYSEFNDDYWWSGELEMASQEKTLSGVYNVTYSGDLIASDGQ